jgi:exonuclease III
LNQLGKKNHRITGIIKQLTIITLNVNGLNSPIKRCRLDDCIKKQYPLICCRQDTCFPVKDIHKTKVKGWKMIKQENGNWKQAGIATLTSDKVHFKPILVIRNEEAH